MMGAAPRPRPFFVISMALLACLYLLYLAGAASVFLAMHGAAHGRVMSAAQELPQSDFARFWYAGKMLCLRRARDFGYEIPLPHGFHSVFQIDILSAGAPAKLLWLYPPTMGLLAMVFASMNLALSFWVWRFFSLAVAAFCLRYAGLGGWVILAGLASPAELHDIIGGQNGALTGGLLVASLLCVEAKPRFGGALAGLLCIKPQAGLVLPVILLQASRRSALSACIITVAGAVLLSVLAEGWQAWWWFFTVAEPSTKNILNAALGARVPGGCTVLLMMRSFQSPLGLAWGVQIGCGIVAAWLVWRRWRRPEDEPIRRMAFTMSLAVLMTPYGFLYDLVGFSIAMAAMFACSGGWRAGMFGLLWLMGGYTLTLENLSGHVLMPVAAVIGAALTWERQGSRAGAENSAAAKVEQVCA